MGCRRVCGAVVRATTELALASVERKFVGEEERSTRTEEPEQSEQRDLLVVRSMRALFSNELFAALHPNHFLYILDRL